MTKLESISCCEAMVKTRTDQLARSTPSAEQRSSPREPFAASLDVHVTTGITYRGVARDLSAGGIGAIVFADTKNFAALKVGDSVVIDFEHPCPQGTEHVACPACVMGRYGNRYGFRFERPMDAV